MRSCTLILLVLLGVALALQLRAEESSVRSKSEPSVEAKEPSVVITRPAEENGPKTEAPLLLTEEQAQDLIWNLPELQADMARILDHGGIPLAVVGLRPGPDAQPGKGNAFYTIHFQAAHVSTPYPDTTFCVEAFTRQISVFDPSFSKLISLEEWRRQRK